MPTKEDLIYDMLKETRDQVKELTKHFVGNGQPGLIVRVDRVERAQKRQTKVGWMLFTAILGTMTAYVLAVFKVP